MGKTRQLTVKEQVFVAAKLDGKSNTEAARQAGYSPRSAPNIGYTIMQRPHIIEALNKTLTGLGVTYEKAIKAIADGLEATKIDKEGIEYKDHAIRLKAADMALKLLKPDKQADNDKISHNTLPNDPKLAHALQSGDEIELQRIVFSKSSNVSEIVSKE